MKKNLIQLGSLFIIIVALVFISVDIAKEKEEQKMRDAGYIGAATLSIEYKDGVMDEYYDAPIKADWSAWDLLDDVSKTATIGISTKEYGDMGVFIESINGVGNDTSDGKWWQIWINDEYAQVGASQILVVDGDTVEFKYTDNKYEQE